MTTPPPPGPTVDPPPAAGDGPAVPTGQSAAVPALVLSTALTAAALWTMWQFAAYDHRPGFGDSLVTAGAFTFTGLVAVWLGVVVTVAVVAKRAIGWMHAVPVLGAFPVGSAVVQTMHGAPVGGALLLLLIGGLLGPVAWFFLVFPVVMAARNVPRVVRGLAAPSILLLPVGWLALGSVVFLLPASVDLAGRGPAAVVSGLVAVLGLPGDHHVESATGLWIVRVLLALVVVLGVAHLATRRRPGTAPGVRPD